MKSVAVLFGTLLLAGCTTAPQGILPVDNFDLDRYLGTWYEIARLDHRFERGLSQVSASYSKRSDGGVDVINRGFSSQANKWKEAKGRAYFIGEPDVARLKVTFFWPFYGGYNVIELDQENYNYALICGPNKKYLWLLARTKTLDAGIKESLIAKAKTLGFNTSELILVKQEE
ncbi:MAG: lipocalin family protein [Desulfuromonadales bacterium]|jgi:apolipoprotein D and lipocalin family protein|nr:lipocalin family protein [Desulfuromonadales bacterium]MDH3809346.1 lipocalin family protein [Desulfuromonadales bacterium]MDH3868505.1 lipocalin family protein [Desulfuromonadales bacterium]MDH4026329.1 lipocalin family protein [Desulfuromonadales bacterium]HKJ30117.1 lipocalin family protein [Desulfuromonadales bacterium]